MKAASVTICVVAILGLAAGVQADYVSTFNVTQADFTLQGFSSGGIPTDGPDTLDITDVIGTYDLDIPPEGGMWEVFVEGTVELDFDKDGTMDATCVIDPISLGLHASSGPQTSWGPGEVLLPEMTFEYDIYSLTLHDLVLGFEVDLDGDYPSGSFGPNAYANFMISNGENGNLGELNLVLTILDNASGGGDGIMDGWLAAQITVTAVPEPTTVGLLIAGGLALLMRRRH